MGSKWGPGWPHEPCYMGYNFFENVAKSDRRAYRWAGHWGWIDQGLNTFGTWPLLSVLNRERDSQHTFCFDTAAINMNHWKILIFYDDVLTLKHFPQNWPLLANHPSPIDSTLRGGGLYCTPACIPYLKLEQAFEQTIIFLCFKTPLDSVGATVRLTCWFGLRKLRNLYFVFSLFLHTVMAQLAEIFSHRSKDFEATH